MSITPGCGGFICFYRKFWRKSAAKMTPVEREIFSYLITMATHSPITIEGVELKRGQMLTSVEKLRKALKWKSRGVEKRYSRQQIRSGIKGLIATNRITNQKTNQKTNRKRIITISNYNKYQDKNESKKPIKKPIKNPGKNQSRFFTIIGQQLIEQQKDMSDTSDMPVWMNPDNSFFNFDIFKKFEKFHPAEADYLKKFKQEPIQDLVLNMCGARKSGQILSSTLANLVKWTLAGAKNGGKPYSEETVEKAIKIYNDKNFKKGDKPGGKIDEKYLRGIIRNEQRQA